MAHALHSHWRGQHARKEARMQEGMVSSLFGALTNEPRMNNISNNLANVNTTGY